MNRAYHPEGVPNIAAHPRPGERIVARLLTELKAAEAAFTRADAPEKEAAGERYRQVLERFNEVIVHRRMPPGVALETAG